MQRQRSRMHLVKQAKIRIDEDQENQRVRVMPAALMGFYVYSRIYDGLQVATDATALIKHYKALLRA